MEKTQAEIILSKTQQKTSECFTVHLQQAIGGLRASEADQRSVWRGRQKGGSLLALSRRAGGLCSVRHNKLNAGRRWGSN